MTAYDFPHRVIGLTSADDAVCSCGAAYPVYPDRNSPTTMQQHIQRAQRMAKSVPPESEDTPIPEHSTRLLNTMAQAHKMSVEHLVLDIGQRFTPQS